MHTKGLISNALQSQAAHCACRQGQRSYFSTTSFSLDTFPATRFRIRMRCNRESMPKSSSKMSGVSCRKTSPSTRFWRKISSYSGRSTSFSRRPICGGKWRLDDNTISHALTFQVLTPNCSMPSHLLCHSAAFSVVNYLLCMSKWIKKESVH